MTLNFFQLLSVGDSVGEELGLSVVGDSVGEELGQSIVTTSFGSQGAQKSKCFFKFFLKLKFLKSKMKTHIYLETHDC